MHMHEGGETDCVYRLYTLCFVAPPGRTAADEQITDDDVFVVSIALEVPVQ